VFAVLTEELNWGSVAACVFARLRVAAG